MSRTGVEPKPAWRELPAEIRRAVQATLGAAVTRAERVYGGYGPTPTFRLRLEDGHRAFFKGVGPQDNEFSRSALKREARIYREAPTLIAPWAPACLGEIEAGAWQVLLLEDLGPKSAPPWTPGLARRVMQELAVFHRAGPGREYPEFLPGPGRYLRGMAQSWERIRTQGGLRAVAGLAIGDEAAAQLWLEGHVDTLSEAANILVSPNAAVAFLHGDLRSDNLRWRDGRLRMFDWPHAGIGAPEFDAVATAETITVEGGPEPEALMEAYRGVLPLHDDRQTAAVAAVAGFFADAAWREELPGLPRLRGFQRAQLSVTLRWFARRAGLAEPEFWLMHEQGGGKQ